MWGIKEGMGNIQKSLLLPVISPQAGIQIIKNLSFLLYNQNCLPTHTRHNNSLGSKSWIPASAGMRVGAAMTRVGSDKDSWEKNDGMQG